MTTGTASNQIVQQVLSVLPVGQPGLTYAEVHRLVGMWAPVTIRHAIRQLREEGLVERAGSQNKPSFHRVGS